MLGSHMYHMYPLPAGSYIVVSCTDGRAVLETYSGDLAVRVRDIGERNGTERYIVYAAGEYLARYNAAVRASGGYEPSTEVRRRFILDTL